jgi:hypothetical protein
MQPFPELMQAVILTIPGDPNWQTAKTAAYELACKGDQDPMLMSWFDQATGKFSPSCCKCDIADGPAWEIYGKNHGGRLRISVNNDRFVFIYT